MMDRLLSRMKHSVLQRRDMYRLRRMAKAAPSQVQVQKIVESIRKVNSNFRRSQKDEVFYGIESERVRLMQQNALLLDGSLGEGGLYDEGVTVMRACSASKPAKAALFLHYLIREFKPRIAIELGTNLGISSAYQAEALKRNSQGGRLVTLEASPYRLRIAQQLHAKLGLENINYVPGLFADTLDVVLDDMGSIDYAFIDGHHQYQPTRDYFESICKRSSEEALCVFDDIHWSEGMSRIWGEIQADERVVMCFDFKAIGVCLVSKRPSKDRCVFPQLSYSI